MERKKKRRKFLIEIILHIFKKLKVFTEHRIFNEKKFQGVPNIKVIVKKMIKLKTINMK